MMGTRQFFVICCQVMGLVWLTWFLTMEPALASQSAEQTALSQARIDWCQVGAPFGRFLLIRQGSSTCAVRFSEFHAGRNAKPPTLFSSGDESHHAEYDWFWQADGSGDFNRTNVQSGHNKLIQRPLQGIGQFAFQTGKVHIRCGPFRLLWQYPVSVSFDDRGGCGDGLIEMAPTRWKEIGEIDINDPHMKWYRCDEQRKVLFIPAEDL